MSNTGWSEPSMRLVKKLIALQIKEMTANMLEVCRIYLTINGEMESMGFGSSKPIHAICQEHPKKQSGYSLMRSSLELSVFSVSRSSCIRWHLVVGVICCVVLVCCSSTAQLSSTILSSITLQEDTKPVVHSPCKCPITM